MTDVRNAEPKRWAPGLTHALFVYSRQATPLTVGLLVFAVYWGAPLLLYLAGPTLDFAQGDTNGRFALFTSDLVYSGFCALVALASALYVRIISRAGGDLAHIVSPDQRGGALALSPEAAEAAFDRHSKLARHWLAHGLGFCLGVAVAATVYDITPETALQSGWWGAKDQGYAGLAAAVLSGFIVMFGVYGLFNMVHLSRWIIELFRAPTRFLPLHPDGRGGLARFRQRILQIWLLALVCSLATILILSSNYLGYGGSYTARTTAALIIVALPFVAFGPWIAIRRRMAEAKERMLARYAATLTARFAEEDLTAEQEAIVDAPVYRHGLLEFYLAARAAPIFPLGLTAVSFFTVLQALILALFSEPVLKLILSAAIGAG